MKQHELERLIARTERPLPTDPESEKPTLVQLPSELLADERAARTIPRAAHESLLELEQVLDSAARASGVPRSAAGPRSAHDSEPDSDRVWSPPPRGDEPSYVGHVIDNRYVVDALIARGGMGVVYRCSHRLIGKKFAVKIIRSDMAQLPDAARRFLMEAKAASAIGNEHIIDIVDYGTLPDGSAFLVMELLEGVPLSDLIARHESLSLARLVRIAIQVCEGLRAAHDAGIVHRDLKPENIFLLRRTSGDFVKILDFGIAKMAPGGEPLTKRGLIVGTPHYMAPEQAAGATVDARGDIYSLGVILFELATGRVPFDATHYMAVLAKHMSEPPPRLPMNTWPQQLAPEFESLVLRCLAKRPELRFQSMTEVIVALERLGRLSLEARLVVEPLPPLDRLPDAVLETGGQSSLPAAGRSIITARERRSTGLAIGGSVTLLALFVSLWRMGGDGEDAGVTGVARLAPRPDPDAPTLAATVADASSELTPLPLVPEDPASLRPGAPSPLAPPTPPASAAGAGLPTAARLREGAPGELPAPPAVVELLPGKSVEIEARTRLSLRVAKDNALFASATPNGSGSRRGSMSKLRSEPRPAARSGGTGGSSGTPPSTGPSATTAAPSATGSGGTHVNKELMNPWPSAPSATEP
jgi:serine/threonine protein kinase